MSKKLDEFIYPVTVEGMGDHLKKLWEDYRGGKNNFIQIEADLRNLMYKRTRLFCSAGYPKINRQKARWHCKYDGRDNTDFYWGVLSVGCHLLDIGIL